MVAIARVAAITRMAAVAMLLLPGMAINSNVSNIMNFNIYEYFIVYYGSSTFPNGSISEYFLNYRVLY